MVPASVPTPLPESRLDMGAYSLYEYEDLIYAGHVHPSIRNEMIEGEDLIYAGRWPARTSPASSRRFAALGARSHRSK